MTCYNVIKYEAKQRMFYLSYLGDITNVPIMCDEPLEGL